MVVEERSDARNIALRRSMVTKSKPSESLSPGTDCPIWEMKTLNTLLARRKFSRDMTGHSQFLDYFMCVGTVTMPLNGDVVNRAAFFAGRAIRF
jgi:hypothetical protein